MAVESGTYEAELRKTRDEVATLKNEVATLRKQAGGADKTRERIRAILAFALVATLIVVVGATFWYLVLLSRNFSELKTDDLISLIPMVGTTLLTPLVGLIGAVTGFYYGGQTANTAANQATAQANDALQQHADTTREAATQAAAQAAQEAARTVVQNARPRIDT
jgi:hypothetical protein